MPLEWDFWGDLNRSLAALDQKLGLFKEYYLGVDAKRRKRFVDWVKQISKPLPDGFEEFTQMMCEIGCTGERIVASEIAIHFVEHDQSARSAAIQPQILRQAVEAWERGEKFAPPIDWNFV